MTLDDETVERIAREVIAGMTGDRDLLVAIAQAGCAYRDAEVEELRAELDILRATEDGNLSAMRERAEKAEAERDRLRDAVESTDRMVESFEKWCTRALTAEATLAKVREWAESVALQPDPPADDEMAGQTNAAGDVLAILDESPTERETPAGESELFAAYLEFYAAEEAESAAESAFRRAAERRLLAHGRVRALGGTP